MSEPGFDGTIVEVFLMRLGGEALVDITLQVAGEGDFAPPLPDDPVAVRMGDTWEELHIWAAPRISHPEGSRRVNIQFRREDVSDRMPEEGMQARVRPAEPA